MATDAPEAFLSSPKGFMIQPAPPMRDGGGWEVGMWGWGRVVCSPGLPADASSTSVVEDVVNNQQLKELSSVAPSLCKYETL